MSKITSTVTRTPYPKPKSFSLAFLKSTSGTVFPTFVASYVGCDPKQVPEPDMLGDINAVTVNFEKMKGGDSPLDLTTFLTPKKELLDFAHSLYFSILAETKPAAKFMEDIVDLGKFSFMINTDYYTYRALIDEPSGEVLESQVEFRYLT